MALTFEQIADSALASGNKLLSREGDKCVLTCLTHGGEFTQHRVHVRKGKTGCKSCISDKNRKTALKQVDRFVAEGRKVAAARRLTESQASVRLLAHGMLLIHKTESSKGRWLAECVTHGNQFDAVGAQLLRGFKNCPDCIEEKQLAAAIIGNKASPTAKPFTLEQANGRVPEGFTITEYLSLSRPKTIRHDACGHEWSTTSSRVLYGQVSCPKCDPSGSSKEERDVYAYVLTLCPDAINGHRYLGRNSVDIYIPSLRIGIEYNGLYWHSATVREVRHIEAKREHAETMGIRVINIYQDEWLKSRAKIEAFLRQALLGADKTIGARQCKVAPVSVADARAFCEANHLQGYYGVNPIGLIHKGEIVAVATTGANKGHRANELGRWCVKQGLQITGGLSKVMAAMPHVTVSYCDLGKHTGAGYIAAGWSIQSQSTHTYWYTDYTERKSRHQFQKHKLKELGAIGNTEAEMAASMGWYQIGGCSQLKLVRQTTL